MCRWIKENVSDWQQTVVCSPDEGGTRRAGILAEKLHLPMALIHKVSPHEVGIIHPCTHVTPLVGFFYVTLFNIHNIVILKKPLL